MADWERISIRRALPDEAPVLTQIALASKRHWGYPERWMELWKPQLMFTPEYFEQHESWVAEFDRAPVGFYTLLEKESSAWLDNLWVIPEHIGEGLGKRLFLHALEVARQRGFRMLQLEADPNAVGFYEKMGMKKVSDRRYKLEGQLRILPTMQIRL